MPIFLSTTDADFEARFAAFLSTKREISDDVDRRAGHHRRRARAGRRGADRLFAPVRPALT